MKGISEYTQKVMAPSSSGGGIVKFNAGGVQSPCLIDSITAGAADNLCATAGKYASVSRQSSEAVGKNI